MQRILFPIAALILSTACASSVSAGVWYTKTVNQTAYVGSAPDSFQIGTMFSGDHFTYNSDDTSPGGGWRWGHARGTANKCGWMDVNALSAGPNNLSSGCESRRYLKSSALGEGSRTFLRTYYACAVNDYVPSSGYWPFFINASTGTYEEVQSYTTEGVFANYDFNTYTFAGPMVGVLYNRNYYPESQYPCYFLWRWVSDYSGSNACVLGKIPGGAWGSGAWGFIPRSALRTDLLYADSNAGNGWRRRYDWMAGG